MANDDSTSVFLQIKYGVYQQLYKRMVNELFGIKNSGRSILGACIITCCTVDITVMRI